MSVSVFLKILLLITHLNLLSILPKRKSIETNIWQECIWKYESIWYDHKKEKKFVKNDWKRIAFPLERDETTVVLVMSEHLSIYLSASSNFSQKFKVKETTEKARETQRSNPKQIHQAVSFIPFPSKTS